MRNPITKRPFAPRLQIPEIFGQALSYEDQILTLIHWVTSTLADVEYVSDDDLTALDAKLTAAIQAVKAGAADDLARAVAELERQIDNIAQGSQLWDVSVGSYRDNQLAMREAARFVAVHALTVEQVGKMEMTVEQLADSGLNCWGLAVLGVWLLDKGFTLPERFKPAPHTAGGDAVTTADFKNLKFNAQNFVVKG